MKSSIHFFLILALLIFFSCSKRSDKPADLDPNPSGNDDKRILTFTLKGKVFDSSAGANSNSGGGFVYIYFNSAPGYLNMQGYSTLLGSEIGDNFLSSIRIKAAILNKNLQNQTFTYAPKDVISFFCGETTVYFEKGVKEIWDYDSESKGELYIENFEFKEGGNIKGTMKIGVKGTSLSNKDEKQQMVISFSGTYK